MVVSSCWCEAGKAHHARHTAFKWAKNSGFRNPVTGERVKMKNQKKLDAFLARRDQHAREAREDVCMQLSSFRMFVKTDMDLCQQQINNLCARDDDYEYIAYGNIALELVDLLLEMLRG